MFKSNLRDLDDGGTARIFSFCLIKAIYKSLIHGVVQFRIIKAGIKLIRQSRTAPTNNRYSTVGVIVAGLQDSISLLFVRGLGHRICWNQYSQAQPQLNFNINFQLKLYLRFLLTPW